MGAVKELRRIRTPLQVHFSQHHGGNEKYRYAAEAVDLVRGLLVQINAFGEWFIHLETKVKSRSNAKIKLRSQSSGGIHLILKPGNNDSAIKVRLICPEGLHPQEVFGRLLLALRNNVTDHDNDDESEATTVVAALPPPAAEAPASEPMATEGSNPLLTELGKLAELKRRVLRWREGRALLPMLEERKQPLLQQQRDAEAEYLQRKADLEKQALELTQVYNAAMQQMQAEVTALDQEAAAYELPSEAEYQQAEHDWAAAEAILQSLRG